MLETVRTGSFLQELPVGQFFQRFDRFQLAATRRDKQELIAEPWRQDGSGFEHLAGDLAGALEVR
jgi:hypothetical protein